MREALILEADKVVILICTYEERLLIERVNGSVFTVSVLTGKSTLVRPTLDCLNFWNLGKVVKWICTA